MTLIVRCLTLVGAAGAFACSESRTEAACPSCEIRMSEVLTLGSLDGPSAIPSTNFTAARDQLGRYWIAALPVPFEVMVFDSSGKILRTIGRRGSGPGEFKFVDRLLPTRNFVTAVDLGAKRNTRINLDTDVIDDHGINWIAGAFIALSDTVFVHATRRDRQDPSNGTLFSVRNHRGEQVHTFGVSESTYDSTKFGTSRLITPASDSTFWATPPNAYHLSLWTVDGRLVQEIRRSPSWFPDGTEPQHGMIAHIHSDRRGRMWVWTLVPDPGRADHTAQSMTSATRDRYWDTIVEVLDPEGRLLASQRLDETIQVVLDGRVFARASEGADGVPHVQIWKYELHGLAN